MRQVAILGAGFAGLAAAQRVQQLGLCPKIYEKNAYIGGHAHSFNVNNFIFDEGVHVSFTKDAMIQQSLANAIDNQYYEQQFIVNNYWRGTYLPHPAQCHLHGLPIELIQECLKDFEEFPLRQKDIPSNYAEWCYQKLGSTFSENFIFPYTRKYWTLSPEKLALDWIGQRVYIPTLEEVKQGAVSNCSSQTYYIQQMRYPKHGGFSAYSKFFSDVQSIHLHHKVIAIDLTKKQLHFKHNASTHFDYLISSLPLPELIKLINDVPFEVKKAAEQLAYTSLAIINIGLKNLKTFPPGHMIYFYDEDVCFSRCSFPHRLSPFAVPEGASSIQLEVYYSKFQPLMESSDDLLKRVLSDLYRIQLLDVKDEIDIAEVHYIPYANVIFDHHRQHNLSIVQDYLEEKTIICCGRYGAWDYYWSDESIKSGWQAASKLQFFSGNGH